MPNRMDSLRTQHFSGVAKHAVSGELRGFWR